MMHKLILTFDIEDFINPNAVCALHAVLEMLDKYRLRAIFFVTGHMAEKLSDFPEILDQLRNHEVGFHSSSHSVHPTIPEYTDVESYKQAYLTSLERETARINPLTGKVEEEGGIYLLQDLFSSKKIEAYRAPGMSWTPPHLEALAELGVRYDFSSNIASSEPVCYKGISFYPYTFMQHWDGSLKDYQIFLFTVPKRKIAIFDLHPTLYVNQIMWDSIYYKGNPPTLRRIPERPFKETTSLFTRFELLLKVIRIFHRAKLVEVDPNPNAFAKNLTMNRNVIEKCYEASVGWPRRYFGYNPRFIREHFQRFFETT